MIEKYRSFLAFTAIFLLPFASWLCAQEPGKSTARSGVEVREHAVYVPYSSSYRSIRVYTPPSYSSRAKRYPVVYALDGQNLFDLQTSYAGEWAMDETLDSLAVAGFPESIVVGIDNHSVFRMQEYNLFDSERFGPGFGGLFLDFVAGDLKEFIDQEYRTLNGRENTAIIGSSMGGLMAFAALVRHPDVFAKAGVYSPAFWISEEYFTLASQLPDSIDYRIYLNVGEGEGPAMVAPFQRMQDSLEARLDPGQFRAYLVPGGQHNERTWATEFPHTYKWWFSRVD